MISQRCPKCHSSSIRKGYKHTPWILRLVGIRHLLCNHCNLLFTGFVVPGTVVKSNRRSRRQKRSDEDGAAELARAKDV